MEVRETPDGRGLGLYATKHFKKGERLGSYIGERIDRSELNKRYGKGRDTVAEYVVMVGKDTFIDDYRGNGILSYSNDPVDLTLMHKLVDAYGYSNKQAYSLATNNKTKNAFMISYAGRATLYTLRHIYPDEEILWSYGHEYWLP